MSSTESADGTLRERYDTAIGGRSQSIPTILSPLRVRLVWTDACLIAAAILIGLGVSARASTWAIDPFLAIYGTPVAIALLWLGMLALRGSYDQRIIGVGTEEIRRVVSATLATFAVVAGTSYLIRADISRAYALVSLPLGLACIIAGRLTWRSWLYRRRSRQELMNPTVVVGSGRATAELIERLARDSFAGYRVVDQYPAPTLDRSRSEPEHATWVQGLLLAIDATNARAVAVAPSESMTSEAIREIAWHLEARPVDLLIAPAILEAVGPRLSVRPAAGIPLLHLDQVSLSRPQRFAKRTLDIAAATTLILLLTPVLLACAVWVRVSSSGPIIFRQMRIGRAGSPFIMLKFRTMVDGAEHMRDDLREAHDLKAPMFKLEEDPRITSAGRFLRRWSLDELPQLFNVLGGSMSLVGPRPHPLDDVDRYEREAFRRLALKPGITGLWQVEGRSDLNWSEALELDLYYIETWSLSGDIVLLLRTVRVVLTGRGAR